jgi:hypothetical protein
MVVHVYNVPQTSLLTALYSHSCLPPLQTMFGGFPYAIFKHTLIVYFNPHSPSVAFPLPL